MTKAELEAQNAALLVQWEGARSLLYEWKDIPYKAPEVVAVLLGRTMDFLERMP